MTPLVSIIIPIYNIEKYLIECVNSILNQTYSNYEVILVDDGSIDNSGKLCDYLSLQNCRIKAFHKKNGGLSSARNYGLRHSIGKYVIFIDSDDYWNNNDILRLLIDKIEKFNLDVVRGEYIDVKENGDILFVPQLSNYKLSFKDKILSPYEMLKYIIDGRFFTVLFLYKRTTIENLLFDENRKFQEDIDFAIRYFSRDLRCGYLPIQFYSYRHRNNSIISKPRLVNIGDSFALTDVFYKYSHDVNDKRLSQLYLYNAIMMYCWTLETVASDIYIDRYNDIDEMVNLKKMQNKVRNWIHETSNVHYPIYIYVKPYIGVCLFRIRWFIGKVLRRIHLYSLIK